jgi:hypothetical protein
MLPILNPPDINRTIIRLTSEEIEDPMPVIEELCHEYEIGEVREFLWLVIEAYLTMPDTDANQRQSLLNFYKMVEKGLEAIYVMMSKEVTKKEDDAE